MSGIIYSLCSLTALLCAFLLLRAFRRTGSRTLWWSGLCFCGLTLSNIVLVLDKLVYTEIDLLAWRLWLTLISLALLIYGLIFAEE